jgi:hypothetical protein
MDSLESAECVIAHTSS